MRPIIAGLLCAVLAAGTALAEGFSGASPLRTLQTADDARGWDAVGRLNFGRSTYCTGALISEDLVLTAAHCLYDRATGRQFRPEQIEFLAGWRGGRSAASRRVARIVTHPDFTFTGVDRVARVVNDVAIVELDRPIRNPSMQPYEVAKRPRKGATVGVVSYARDRSEAPSIQDACRVLARQGGVLVLNCDVDHGASGSPVFVTGPDGKAQIVSVVSAMANVRGRDVALGTALTRPLDTLFELLSEPEVANLGDPVLPTVRSLGGSTSGGAKFVSPSN